MGYVAVVGGGISGLTAAFTLQEHGHDVVVFEASERLGGVIHTEQVDGLLIDAGPDSFLSSKPSALALIRQLGIAGEVINTRHDGGGTYILHDGRLVPLPEGLTMLVPTQLSVMARSPLLSWHGKARMALEYFIPARRGANDESVGAFVTRRLGRETYENIAEPLLSGIYSGDANQLSLQATFPRLRDVERQYGGIIRGALAQKKQAGNRGATRDGLTPFVSLRNGMSELIGCLAAALERTDIRTGTRVKAIRESGQGCEVLTADGSTVSADAAALTTAAHISADIIEDFAPDLAAALREIPYASSATVSFAYNASAIAESGAGRGFVIPRKEGRRLKAVTWTSSKFEERAPEGVALLRGFVGRAGDQETPKLPDDQLIGIVQDELADILDITAEPLLARVYRYIDALPQYNLGHPQRVERIECLAADVPSLAFAGSAYHGIGIPDCISTAQSASEELAARLS